MSPLNSNRILSYGTVLLTALTYLIISSETNHLLKQVAGSEGFMNFLYATNNLLAFTIPILTFAFLTVTTKMMLSLGNLEFPKNKSINLPILVGLSFIPLLVYAMFFSLSFMLVDPGKGITDIDDLEQITFFWGLQLNDLNLIGYFAWVLVYAIMIATLKYYLKLTYVMSALVVLVPTVLIYIMKKLFTVLL